MSAGAPLTAIHHAIMAQVQKSGAVGLRQRDLSGPFTLNSIKAAVRRLVGLGMLHNSRNGMAPRLFSTAEYAHNYATAPTQMASAKTVRQTSRFRPDAKVVYPVDANGNPTYRVTLCPSCDERSDGRVRSGTYDPW